jgi:ribosomal protein S21
MADKFVNVEVRMNDFDSFEGMVKRFSKKVKKDGIIKDLLKRRYFKSKSEKLREVKQRKKRINDLEKINAHKKNSK